MSATVLYMSQSLDGYVTGPDAGPGNGLGDGGEVLHAWALPGGRTDHKAIRELGGVNGQVARELMATGAVVVGRGTFDPAGGWGGDHHDGVPVFVVSRRPAPPETERWPLVTFVDDVATAMERARRAAGGRDVLVHGATLAQLALAAGVLDELELHLVPVLLGDGRRLFEHATREQLALERVRVLQGEGGVTHLRYRVRR